MASSRLKLELELERALSARRHEFERGQLPILEAVTDPSKGSFAVDVEVGRNETAKHAHPPILGPAQNSAQREELEDLLNVVLRQLEKKSQ
jgi:hypothetical protein